MSGLVQLVLRWLLGAVFVFAGALKIFDPASFATDISHYRLLPLAQHNDGELRIIGLHTLASVGGPRSLSTVKAAVNGPSARRALIPYS